MLENWRECKLGDVAIINPPESLKKGTLAKKIPMDALRPFTKKISQYTIEQYNGGVKFKNGDTLVARITPSLENGKTSFVDILDESEIGFGSTEFIVLREKNGKSDKHFLYYLAISPEFRDIAIKSMNGSSGRERVQNEVVFEHEFSLPPLQEQKVIAEILSSLDDKIDLLHRQNHTLESLAQTLFRQWFIEDAKETRMGKISDWIEDTIGGDWGKENPIDDFSIATYCIRGTDIADLNNGLPSKTPIRYIKQKKLENIQPKEGDIILEISGGTENQSTGRTTYINDEIKKLFKYPIIFSNFCRLIRIKKKEYSYFLYLYLQYLYVNDEFFGLENGSSGIKNLNYKVLLNDLEYQMPVENQVLEFNNNVKSYFNKINHNKKQIQTLENLRDTLLPKLISGEVRVTYE